MLWVVNQLYNIYIQAKSTYKCKGEMYYWCLISAEQSGTADMTSQDCFDAP